MKQYSTHVKYCNVNDNALVDLMINSLSETCKTMISRKDTYIPKVKLFRENHLQDNRPWEMYPSLDHGPDVRKFSFFLNNFE